MKDKETLNNFLQNLKKFGYSRTTLESYKFNIIDFQKFLNERGLSLNNFSNLEVVDYKDLIKNLYSPQTVNVKLASIKKFVLYNKKLNFNCNVPPIKTKNKKNIKTIDNFNDLLREVDKKSKSCLMKERDKNFLKILYYTGLKTKEVTNLKPKNIKENALIIKNKTISLKKDLISDLKKYIKKIGIENNQFIFYSFSPSLKNSLPNKPLTEKAIEEMFNKYKKDIDSDITIRDLRNSYIIKQKNELPGNISEEYDITTLSVDTRVGYLDLFDQ